MRVTSYLQTVVHSVARVWGLAVNGVDPDWLEDKEKRFEEQLRRLDEVKRRQDAFDD
jgi:hypothetical protein